MSETRFTSEAVENYLKAIYQLSEEHTAASPQGLAQRLSVSVAGANKMLRHLQSLGLAEYSPYHGAQLTDVGRKVALEVIRHHRLLELYLMQALGYGWDRVHAEAERLEHHISEEFEDRIDQLLGSPEFDPHGDPIPTREGAVLPLVTTTLESQETGAAVIVRRVTDEDEVLLRYFAERNIRPGTWIQLLDREPFGGSLRLRVGDREERLAPDAARQVFVEKEQV